MMMEKKTVANRLGKFGYLIFWTITVGFWLSIVLMWILNWNIPLRSSDTATWLFILGNAFIPAYMVLTLFIVYEYIGIIKDVKSYK